MPFIQDKEPAAAVWRRFLEKSATPLGPVPDRQEVRRILAQSPTAALPALAMGGLPAVGGLVQGATNEDAQTVWSKIADVKTKAEPGQPETPQQTRAHQAIQQMLSIPEGITLVRQLGRLFGKRDKPTLEIHFVNKLKKDFEGAGGYFVPEEKGQPKYQIYIRNDTPMEGVFSREWPQGEGPKISSLSVDSASNMARTLHHELLHVWYLHTQDDGEYPTGHGDVGEREIAQLFWDRLKKFAEQQDDFTRPARERR